MKKIIKKVMKKMFLQCLLLGGFLLLGTSVSAQRFAPSANYQQIQMAQYDASGLYLQTDKRLKGTRISGFGAAGNSYFSSGVLQIGTPSVPQLQGVSTISGLGTWKGTMSEMGSEAPALVPSKRRAIGGGDGGKPGPPVHVPIGNAPWVMMVLVALGYAGCRVRRIRRG